MPKKGDPDLEVYPNSPLIEVVSEIRFPGELEVETNRHLFWNKIRSEYPNILVPHAVQGKPPALDHYRFRNEDRSRTVSVALHSLAFSASQYSGHLAFIEEFARLCKLFQECFPLISRVNRIGWRYVNIIPFTRENGLVPVGNFLDASLVLSAETLHSPKMFDIKVETKVDDGVVVLRLATVNRKGEESSGSQEGILLDIDFGFEGSDLKFSDYTRCIEHARKHNRELFEKLIKEEYREYLRGETL